MTSALKRRALRLADASGAFAVARRLTWRLPRILMYHRFCAPGVAAADSTPADVLRRQLEHIGRCYHPIPLYDLVRAHAAGQRLPAQSVAITVDDGHADFLRWAFPVLQDLGIPATLFVVSDPLDGGRWLWTDQFRYVAAHDRDVATDAVLNTLKRLPPLERTWRLDGLARQAGVAIPDDPPEPYALLTGQALTELAQSGLVAIGSHTRTHATLCSVDREQSWDEVAGSRHDLERRLSLPIATFCYPNGHPGDYRPEHAAMVAQAGYLGATAAHFGFVTAASDRFALPRIGCDSTDMVRFRQYVDGVEYLRRRLGGERCW